MCPGSLCGGRGTHTPLWHISHLDLQSTSSCCVESEDDTYLRVFSRACYFSRDAAAGKLQSDASHSDSFQKA